MVQHIKKTWSTIVKQVFKHRQNKLSNIVKKWSNIRKMFKIVKQNGQTWFKQVVKHRQKNVLNNRQTSHQQSSKQVVTNRPNKWSNIVKHNDLSCGPPKAANRPSHTKSLKVVNQFIATLSKHTSWHLTHVCMFDIERYIVKHLMWLQRTRT
jgi:hypothetical protein